MSKYDGLKLKIKSQAEMIRTTPLMYMGREFNEDGFYFLLFLIAQYALDPKYANNNAYLEISIFDSNSVVMTDHGRGLPIDEVFLSTALQGSKLELVLTKRWRNKFDDDYYQEFGFLDYMGSVLCAVSSDLKIETHFENKTYSIRCSKGEITESLKEFDCQEMKIGTRMKIMPDCDLFGDWQFKQEKFSKVVEKLAEKHPEAEIIFKDGR